MIKYLIGFSIKNLSRNKRRTLLSILAIIISVAMLIIGYSMLAGITNDLIAMSVREYGHIFIQKKNFTKLERMNPLDENINDIDSLMKELKKFKEIKLVVPAIKFGGMFIKDNEFYNSYGFGIDKEAGLNIMHINDYIMDGNYFSGDGKEIVIGLEIAKYLNVKAGDKIILLTRDINGSFTGGKFNVTGIIDFKSKQENSVFLINIINVYQMLKNTDLPQKLLLFLNSYENAPKVKKMLLKNEYIKNNEYDVFMVNEAGMFKGVFRIINFMMRMIFNFFIIVALIAIANTMIMTILERTNEVGVLQAIGLKSYLVGSIFIFESLAIGIIGSFIGACIGSLIAFYFQINGISFGNNITNGMPIPIKSVIYPHITFKFILQFFVIGILISFFSGVFPALKILKIKPAQAIKDGK